MIRRIALFAILVAGCRNGSKPSSAPGDSLATSVGSAPAQFSDLAPGDTAAVIAMMRQTMSTIDAQLAGMVQRDTIVTPAGDSLPRHLTAWLQDGVVRKLVAVDTNSTGANSGETDIWFMGGDVAVVQQVADVYAIDGGRIVLWTDGSLQPRDDVTPALLMARETDLIETVRRWLAAFDIQLP